MVVLAPYTASLTKTQVFEKRECGQRNILKIFQCGYWLSIPNRKENSIHNFLSDSFLTLLLQVMMCIISNDMGPQG